MIGMQIFGIVMLEKAMTEIALGTTTTRIYDVLMSGIRTKP